MSVAPGALSTRAPAKINLTLHVLGRRADGYHALESLVAFAGVADDLSLTPGPDLALHVDGQTAPLAGEPDENLVLKAARLLRQRLPGLKVGAFRLTKRLPVAAGLGGGSSDAAAALRLLARLNDLSVDHPAVIQAAQETGSDVPVCLEARARMMRGAGEVLGPPLRMPPLFFVLVNPGVPVPTPAVFAALGLARGASLPGAPHPPLVDGPSAANLLAAIASARNDLEGPAVRVAPVVAEASRLLKATAECRLARMSGSGGSVFALYPTQAAAEAAAREIRRQRSSWWIEPTALA